MTKYRIKVKETASGVKLYYPQYRSLIFWCCFDRYTGGSQHFYTKEDAVSYLKPHIDGEVVKTWNEDVS